MADAFVNRTILFCQIIIVFVLFKKVFEHTATYWKAHQYFIFFLHDGSDGGSLL